MRVDNRIIVLMTKERKTVPLNNGVHRNSGAKIVVTSELQIHCQGEFDYTEFGIPTLLARVSMIHLMPCRVRVE